MAQVAEKVKDPAVPKPQKTQLLRQQLAHIVFPDSFQLPLDPHFRASGLILDRCCVKDSKKLPLWLEFSSAVAGQPALCVLYKAGDDLRQDQLTLQVIRTMDALWQNEGLQLCMSPYRVVATGRESGMIEVVGNADTIANILSSTSPRRAAAIVVGCCCCRCCRC